MLIYKAEDPFKFRMEWLSIITVLLGVLSHTVLEGYKSSTATQCQAPQTYANTVCKLQSNETYPVSSKTKLRCFCSYNGHNATENLQIVNDKGKEVELECRDDGTWNNEAPICSHNSMEELPIQIISLERPGLSPVKFTSENMTLLQMYASGTKNIAVFITNPESTVHHLGLDDIFSDSSPYIISDLKSLRGYAFGLSHWKEENIKQNLKKLKEDFQLEVLFKAKDTVNWWCFNDSTSNHEINSSLKKTIALNITHSQPAVIAGIKLELPWSFGAESIMVNKTGVDFKVEWNKKCQLTVLDFSYPDSNEKTSRIEVNITSSYKRYYWPIYNVILLGEKNDETGPKSVEICGHALCIELENFKKQGRYFSREYKSITLKLNFSDEIHVQKVRIGLYDPIDVKLNTSHGNLNGLPFLMKENSSSFNNSSIIFYYPEPVIMQSQIELEFEISSGMLYWPFNRIKLLGQSGHPGDWCSHQLENITKILTTVDMCYHVAGEMYDRKSTKVRLNQTDANAQCALINGTLAEPRNERIQEKIQLHLNNYIFLYYWIGVIHSGSADWMWASGDPVDIKYFANKSHQTKKTDSPKDEGLCVVLDKRIQFKWARRQCSSTNKYICQSGYVGCGYPHKKEFALINVTKRTHFPLEVHYSCPDGFDLIGHKTRTCDKGVWSNESPTCEKRDFGASSSPPLVWTSQTSQTQGTHQPSLVPGVTLEDSLRASKVESATINVAALSLIIICVAASAILIAVAVIMCYLKRRRSQEPDKTEMVDEKESRENAKIEEQRKYHNQLTLEQPAAQFGRSQLHNMGTIEVCASSSKSQGRHQEIEMVESDIYDSFQPRNIMIDNDIYGTM